MKKAPPKPPEPTVAPKLADTNGDRNVADAAKETAAQAKSTVTTAASPTAIRPGTVPLVGPEPSRVPLAAMIAAGVLAILLVLVVRRHGDD